ncbi:MAG: helix-turn-helix domain-containing protein, partial [Acidimicrobiia bacterium]|nr:helix-turn-helix domain-containing protein [Acidimicrobiia bacterium]
MFEPRQYDGVQGDVPRLTFSVSQAAELLGISRAKAYECARTGELPVICSGGGWWCPRSRSTAYSRARSLSGLPLDGVVEDAAKDVGGISVGLGQEVGVHVQRRGSVAVAQA